MSEGLVLRAVPAQNGVACTDDHGGGCSKPRGLCQLPLERPACVIGVRGHAAGAQGREPGRDVPTRSAGVESEEDVDRRRLSCRAGVLHREPQPLETCPEAGHQALAARRSPR